MPCFQQERPQQLSQLSQAAAERLGWLLLMVVL